MRNILSACHLVFLHWLHGSEPRKWVHKADVDNKKLSQAGWSDEDTEREAVLQNFKIMESSMIYWIFFVWFPRHDD